MRRFNPTKKTRFGKKRRKPIVMFGFVLIVLIVLLVLGMKFNHIFKLNDDQTTKLILGFYIGIAVSSFILIINTIYFFRARKLLEADLENIYFNKGLKGKIIIPMLEIIKLDAKVKTSKRRIINHGTLIIKAKKTYRIKACNNVEFVKNEIKHLIERQQAYLMGVKAGKEMADEQNILEN